MATELTATIWISDMSGFTLLTHLQGPQKVMDMVFAMRETVSAAIRARRGHVFKCVADNVFAIFDTLGFTQLYRVFASEDEALASLAGDR